MFPKGVFLFHYESGVLFFFSVMNPVFLCLISLNILVFNSIESVDDAGEFA